MPEIKSGDLIAWDLLHGGPVIMLVETCRPGWATLMAADGYSEVFPHGLPQRARHATADERAWWDAHRQPARPIAYE